MSLPSILYNRLPLKSKLPVNFLCGNFLTEPFSAVSIPLHSHPIWSTTLTVRHFLLESFAVPQICCAAVTFRMCKLAVGLWLCKCDVLKELRPQQSNNETGFRVFNRALEVSHASNSEHNRASPGLTRLFSTSGLW